MINTGLTSGTNIYGDILKAQASGNAANAAKAQAKASAATTTWIIFGVIGLAVVGIIFAVIAHHK